VKKRCQKIRGYNTHIYPVFLAFTDEDVAAQAITFFGDGFETSSSALSFLLYSLATNPDVQERVREEVESVLKRHGNKLTFDSIQEMPYLDMVLAGTLHSYVGNVTCKTNFGYTLILIKKYKRGWACNAERSYVQLPLRI
jgi:Cytochrome P450